MRRIAFAVLALFALGALAPEIHADTRTRPVKILGKKNRRELRYELYGKRLQGDKLRVFRKHGLTNARLRVDRGPTLEQCHFQGPMDDQMNVQTTMLFVMGVRGSTLTVLHPHTSDMNVARSLANEPVVDHW